ncbi:MAG: hypothetical protein ACOX60_12600 [Massiliimalia sp.]|jgi:hypothetical protein
MKLDSFSYACGVIDCFNEMVHAGLKKIALSHPCSSRDERDELIPFCREICQQYGTQYYVEDQPLITDLFPVSMNQGKYNIIFYREEQWLKQYLALKEEKQRLCRQGKYRGEDRLAIALGFGELLSYPKEDCLRLISQNEKKEPEQPSDRKGVEV